ncbi:MAG TPA: carboxypeptidase-like regulatory domain-containing protein, partial [Terriglobales bacterium]
MNDQMLRLDESEGGAFMTMKRLTSLLCGCALVLCLGVMIGAQEVTSTIVGTVVDSSGAVVPGATVKLT